MTTSSDAFAASHSWGVWFDAAKAPSGPGMARTSLSEQTLDHLIADVACQDHAMAGSIAAVSAAFACSLGEACVRISALYLDDETDRAKTEPISNRLAAIRKELLSLADEDGILNTGYAAAKKAGEAPKVEDRLCEIPVYMCNLAIEAGVALQGFRPLVRPLSDDLEIAISLLASAGRAASTVLDSNLRIWPEGALLVKYRPALADVRRKLARLGQRKRFG